MKKILTGLFFSILCFTANSQSFDGSICSNDCNNNDECVDCREPDCIICKQCVSEYTQKLRNLDDDRAMRAKYLRDKYDEDDDEYERRIKLLWSDYRSSRQQVIKEIRNCISEILEKEGANKRSAEYARRDAIRRSGSSEEELSNLLIGSATRTAAIGEYLAFNQDFHDWSDRQLTAADDVANDAWKRQQALESEKAKYNEKNKNKDRGNGFPTLPKKKQSEQKKTDNKTEKGELLTSKMATTGSPPPQAAIDKKEQEETDKNNKNEEEDCPAGCDPDKLNELRNKANALTGVL
ncbi:MAG: hypothetical protein LBQ28_02250 [Prevotellaceae bacterium]|nr:hypothetical protein [Prevotellaceae bacterium]